MVCCIVLAGVPPLVAKALVQGDDHRALLLLSQERRQVQFADFIKGGNGSRQGASPLVAGNARRASYGRQGSIVINRRRKSCIVYWGNIVTLSHEGGSKGRHILARTFSYTFERKARTGTDQTVYGVMVAWAHRQTDVALTRSKTATYIKNKVHSRCHLGGDAVELPKETVTSKPYNTNSGTDSGIYLSETNESKKHSQMRPN